MSINRKNFRKRIRRHQRRHNQFEDEVVDQSWLVVRQKYIQSYFEKNAWKFKQHPKLNNPHQRDLLQFAMYKVYGRGLILICVDVETWEQSPKDETHILEVGISIYDPRGQQHLSTPNVKTYHLVNSDNLKLKNGRYVPNHREYFMGATLWRMSLLLIKIFIQGLFDYYSGLKQWSSVLVGHGLQNDIKYLRHMGIEHPFVHTIDTEKLFALSRNKTDKTNLRTALKETMILSGYMHNGANDAYYTLQLLFKLADPELRTLLKLDDVKFPRNVTPKINKLSEKTPSAEFMNPESYSAMEYALPEPLIEPNQFFDWVYEDSNDVRDDECMCNGHNKRFRHGQYPSSKNNVY